MKLKSLYIFLIVIWCNLLVNANAVPKTESGKGELILSEAMIDRFYDYITKPANLLPLIFFISEDQQSFYTVIIKQDGKGVAGSGYIRRQIPKCERKLQQKCYVFSNSRYIVWDNGINPRKGKKFKISSKISKEDLIIRLSELGFIETKDQKIKKEKELAEVKAAKEKKLAEVKAAKEKKLAEEKAAKEKELAEVKAAKEKLEKKLSLIPVETDLEKAQNFLKNLQDFIKLYPDEFDIIKVSEYFILTKPIVDGNLDIKLEEDLKNLKKFSETSNKFVKYIEEFKINQEKVKLENIDKTILSLETTISRIKKYMSSSPNSIHLEKWLASVKSAEKVLSNPISYDQLIEEAQKLNKVIEHKKKLYKTQIDAEKTLEILKKYLPDFLGLEISELILKQIKNLDDKIKSEIIDDIIIANKSAEEFIEKEIEEPIRIAEEKKRIEYLKTPEGKAEAKAEKEKKLAEKREQKRKEKYKNNPVQITCNYNLEQAKSTTWMYDGEKIYMDSIPLKLGKNNANSFDVNVKQIKDKKDTFEISYLFVIYEIDFYKKKSYFQTLLGTKGAGTCY